MSTELKQALEVIKKHLALSKGKSFEEMMETSTLKQRIETINGNLLHYVDHQTINYYYTQYKKKNPNSYGDYKVVELSEKQRKDCISALKRLKNDVEACIGHLEK